MKVSQIMIKKVVTVEAHTPVNEIARKLVENNLTGVPVVKGKEVIGIVTEADLIMQKAKLHVPTYINILSSFLYLDDPSEVETELKKMLATRADELMTESVITVKQDDKIQDLATLFEEEHVNPVPVVDDKNKLVGIVSRADIVKLMARES